MLPLSPSSFVNKSMFSIALHLVSGYLHPCLEQLRLESFTVTSEFNSLARGVECLVELKLCVKSYLFALYHIYS